jgi:hypothetical protein
MEPCELLFNRSLASTATVITPNPSLATSSEQVTDSSKLGLLPRLISAGWFAAAASIPVTTFLLIFGASSGRASGDTTLSLLWIFGVIPIVSAAFFGFSLGSPIVDPLRDLVLWRAVRSGILIACLSYVVFMTSYIVSLALSNRGDPGFMSYVIMAMIIVSLLLGGWLIVLAGALGGWLLWRVARRPEVREVLLNAPRVTARTSNAMVTAAAALTLINCVLGGVLFSLQAPRY